jgi:predicted metalloprotease with PDZ domain
MNAMSLPATDAAVTYHLRPRSPNARIFEVFCRVRDPDPAGQVFSLPAWIPGSYMIRDFARSVVSIEAFQGDEPQSLRKLDKSTWRAAPAAGEIVVRMEVFAGDNSVRGASLDAAGAFFNGSSVFLRVHGREAERCTVHISPGEESATAAWQVATAMSRIAGTAWEFGAFEARGYDELIDHPVVMGQLAIVPFEAGGTEHFVVLAGRHEADLPRLAADLTRLCAWQIDFFGRPAPMDRYLFLVRLTGDGHGGLEHRASTALVCHRNSLPAHGQPGVGTEYRRFLGLASHEYFHAWHVKRIRPAELDACTLDREVYTRQLWIFEGITSYYDDLALLRSGLIPMEAYLELLGKTLTSVYRTQGRRRQTLEDASFDAWIKFYRPDENSPNAAVSYYGKGAMVALALDLETRLRTEGRRSLDDIMRVLWETHGRQGGPALADGGFEELASEVTGLDLSEFFRNNVRGVVDPPVGILLAQFGVRLNLRAAEGSGDNGGRPGKRNRQSAAWLGLRYRTAGGRLRVTHVLDGGPAQRAGIIADDEIIAIRGIRVESDSLDGHLERLVVGRPAEIHLFRRDELLQLALVPDEPPKDTCYLTLDDQAAAAAFARRREWLATPRG